MGGGEEGSRRRKYSFIERYRVCSPFASTKFDELSGRAAQQLKSFHKLGSPRPNVFC